MLHLITALAGLTGLNGVEHLVDVQGILVTGKHFLLLLFI
jgi:hypothetical protein